MATLEINASDAHVRDVLDYYGLPSTGTYPRGVLERADGTRVVIDLHTTNRGIQRVLGDPAHKREWGYLVHCLANDLPITQFLEEIYK